MLAPDNANQEPASTKSNVTEEPVQSPQMERTETITVSVDENLLALLGNETAPRTATATGLVRAERTVAVSAGASFAGLGRPTLVRGGEAFHSQPLGPHIVGPALTTNRRSFGVMPTTSRRIFGQPPSDSEATSPSAGAASASASVAASLEPAIHLPVSHLSSSFGSTWNGMERRKMPRIPDSLTINEPTLDPLKNEARVESVQSPVLSVSTAETAPAPSLPGNEVSNQQPASKPESQMALAVLGSQTDNSPGLVLYQSPRPNRLPLLLLFGATAATLAGLTFFFGFTPAGQAHPSALGTASSAVASPLQLKVESKDHSFIGIRWNPECLPVLNAEAGRLIVLESDHAPRVIDLQPAQLKIGHIYYETNFERVEFRLEVEDATGTVTKESFLALLPGRTGHPAKAGLSVVSPGAPEPAPKLMSLQENLTPASAKPGVTTSHTPPSEQPAYQSSPAPSRRGATSLALVQNRSNPK